MPAPMRRWSKRFLVIGAMIALVAGAAWADSHLVPPLKEFPVEEFPSARSAPGWQEFLTYREILRWAGGVIQALIVLLVVAHLAIYGFRHVKPTGRMVRRYNVKEVLLHTLLALAFVGAWASSTYLILAKHVLGYAEQGIAVPFGRISSTVHITAGFLFLGALLALAFMWRPAMRFASYDRDWMKQLGGYFSRSHRILPAERFNAGQKSWFYFSLVLGVAVAASGALIYYPDLIGPRWGIILYMVHTVLVVALSAAVIVHLYLAVLVHPQGIRSMITGKVDEACLRQDHPLAPLPASGKGSG